MSVCMPKRHVGKEIKLFRDFIQLVYLHLKRHKL